MACRSCCYVISKETTILLRGGGGGGPHISMAGFFAETSAKYFSFPGDHFHLTVKGVIKYRGRGWWRMPNSAKLPSTTSADVKGTKWSTIKS